ncbi:MAG: hypothetical protein RLZZ416_833 [Candidatus Parcubacteria bacterium]|jgi:tRNA dimethylallyltransferase
MKKEKLLVIAGPTSSGKSALAVALARRFGGEIISADSRQVYRGLDVGTGKVTKREMRGVPHYLLDAANPRHTFTAHDFVARAMIAVSDIARRGKLPIIAGGSGFYIDALLGRIVLPDVPANASLRAKLEKKSSEQLLAMLRRKDSRRANVIDRYNKRRLIRALEIAAAVGKSPRSTKRRRFDAFWIGIKMPRDELNKKIHDRLHARMRSGMVAEAKRLHSHGLSYKRMEELGLEYRYLARYLQNRITRAPMMAELDAAIRQYAKRQLTYWKRNRDIAWLDAPPEKRATGMVARWLSK